MSDKQKAPVADTKTVGGQIPEDLYWRFKKCQATRHESSTKALENAIRLYCDVQPQTEEEDSQNGSK